MTRLVTADVLTRLGAADGVLGFGGGRIGEEPPSKRTLQLDGTDAFELSFWCGTCPLLFERLAGANRTLSSDQLANRLESPLDDVDLEVLRAASEVLPIGDYLPMLLDVSPSLVNPLGSGDYFAEEQVEYRGVDAFWGLPHDAHTPYYRAGERTISATEQLYEFVVPMVPPSWNDAARVEHYSTVLAAGHQPTALAVAVLDVTQPWDSTQAHWGLTHFLLDGHHKLYAAALGGYSLATDAAVRRRQPRSAGPSHHDSGDSARRRDKLGMLEEGASMRQSRMFRPANQDTRATEPLVIRSARTRDQSTALTAASVPPDQPARSSPARPRSLKATTPPSRGCPATFAVRVT